MDVIQKKQYGILFIILFMLFGLASIYDGGTMINRGIRLFPNVVALGVLLIWFKPKTNPFILAFLACLLISDCLAFYYEKPILKELTLFFNLLAYILLGFAVIPKFSKIKAGWFLGIYFLICLVFWAYTLFQLIEISRDQIANSSEYILMNLNSLGLIFILSSALLYVHQNPSKIAMTFLGFVFVYILSELARGASYYSPTRIDMFFYGCRILYALAMALAVYSYALMNDSEKEKTTISNKGD
jgi:uncharacterized membrane protein